MKQKFIVTVSVIVYKKDGSLLVTERSKNEIQGAGMLSYCGGKIDNLVVQNSELAVHSIFQETGLRELKEEVGVEIFEDSLVMINNHAFKRFDGDFALMIVFLGLFKSQGKVNLNPIEIKSYKWLKFREINKEKMYDSVYRVYCEANEYLKNNNLIEG